MKVTYEGKYLHMVDNKKYWLEIPRNEHEEGYAMWFRTLHSKNDDYFAWIINEDGTMSSKNNQDLVLGFGISNNENHWYDTANKLKWNKFKEIEGFTLKKDSDSFEKIPDKLGPYFKLVGEEDQWIEIPHSSTEVGINLWLRTHHGGHEHFAYEINKKDATISPEGMPELVFGLGPSTHHHWKGTF